MVEKRLQIAVIFVFFALGNFSFSQSPQELSERQRVLLMMRTFHSEDQIPTNIYSEYATLRIEINLIGEVETTSTRKGGIFVYAHLDLLKNELIRKELNLNNRQERLIAKFVNSLESEQAVLPKDLGKIVSRRKRNELLKRHQDSAKEEIQSILSRDQIKRLEQIGFRIQLRREGILTAIGKQRRHLKINEYEFLCVYDLLNESEPAIVEESTSLAKMAVEKILNGLTKLQRESLTARFGTILTAQYKDLNFLSAQLDTIDRKRFEKVPMHSMYDVFRGLGSLEMQRDGSWKLVHRKSNRPDRYIAVELANVLQKDPKTIGELGLSEHDAAIFGDLYQNYTDRRALISERMKQKILSGENQDDVRQQYSPEMLHIVETLRTGLESQLGQTGMENTRHRLQSILIMNNGLFAELIYGDLAKELKLTAEQQKQIKQACNEQKQTIAKKSLQIENEILNKVENVLDRESRRILKETVGSPLDSISSGGPTLLLRLPR